jgi:hypothetical protein
MNAPQIAYHIAWLKGGDQFARRHATAALGEIGDAFAIPVLVEVLKDDSGYIRWSAAEALGKIGDASAVSALVETLKDQDTNVRCRAAEMLGKIGDSVTLPRKILASSRLLAQERIEVLDTLRRARGYRFADTPALCRTVLNEEDLEARLGAQNVLDWLNGDRHLLRPAQRDPTRESQELLRPVQGTVPEPRPETLLRPVDAPENREVKDFNVCSRHILRFPFTDAQVRCSLPNLWLSVFALLRQSEQTILPVKREISAADTSDCSLQQGGTTFPERYPVR